MGNLQPCRLSPITTHQAKAISRPRDRGKSRQGDSQRRPPVRPPGQPARQHNQEKQPTAELKSEAKDIEDALKIVKASRGDVSKRCRAGDLDQAQQLDALLSRDRLLLDVIRMIADCTETRMMLPIVQAQGKQASPPETAPSTPDRRCRHPAGPGQRCPPGPHSRHRKRRLRPPDRCHPDRAQRRQNSLPRDRSSHALRGRRSPAIHAAIVAQNHQRSGCLRLSVGVLH